MKDGAKSFKVTQTKYPKGGGSSEGTKEYTCYTPQKSNPWEDLTDLVKDKEYYIKFTIYSGERCTGDNLGYLARYLHTYIESVPNQTYIGVSQIESKLGSCTYANKSGGQKVSCASYGIDDEQANVPLCIALSQTETTQTNCAEFLRQCYSKAGMPVSGSIYEKGTSIGTYNSYSATVPNSLKDGDLITFYNGDTACHVGMVFKNAKASDAWYVVNSNMSDKVKIMTLKYTINKSCWDDELKKTVWTKYIFRSV